MLRSVDRPTYQYHKLLRNVRVKRYLRFIQLFVPSRICMLYTSAMIAEASIGSTYTEQELLAAIITSSDDAIVGKTLDGTITTWNHGAELLYGYTAQEAIGKSITIIIPTDRQDELSFFLEKVRRGEHVQHHETKRQRKDGTVLDVSLSLSPIRDASGAICGAAAIARDITEQMKMRYDLENKIQELEKMNDLAVDRELKMTDLREEIEEIKGSEKK